MTGKGSLKKEGGGKHICKGLSVSKLTGSPERLGDCQIAIWFDQCQFVLKVFLWKQLLFLILVGDLLVILKGVSTPTTSF